MSVVERIDAGTASLRAAGHQLIDVVLCRGVYCTFMVQDQVDTLEREPTTIRGLPIVRVRDSLKSIVGAGSEGRAAQASCVIA